MLEYLIAGATLAVVTRYINKRSPQIKGFLGEAKLARAVKKLNLPGNVKILRDSLFDAQWGGTSQMDVLAVTRYGIIVLENKNFNCDVYGAIGNETWSFRYPSGGLPKNPFDFTNSKRSYAMDNSQYSPVKQNNNHVAVLADLLRKQYPHVPLYPLVVFSDKANLYVQNSRNKVCNLQQLPYVVPRILGSEMLNDQQVEEIASFLEKKRIKNRRARKAHITTANLSKQVHKELTPNQLRQIREKYLHASEDKPVLNAYGEAYTLAPSRSIDPTRPLSQIISDAESRSTSDLQPQRKQHTR